MNNTVAEEDLTYIQTQYWNKMCQYRFDLFYYAFYKEKCTRIMRNLKIISIGTTTLCTACCMKWSDIKYLVFIFGIIIILSQVYNSVSHLIPYEKWKSELTSLSNDVEKIYSSMEQTWRKIASGKLSTYKGIDDELSNYISQWEEKRKYYFKDDSLPFNQKIKTKADEEAYKYLNNLMEVNHG